MRSQALAVVLLFACAVTVIARDPSVAAVPAPRPVSALAAESAGAGQEASAVESSLDLDRPARRLIQQGLNNEGFDAGAPDGLFGPRTRAAIRRWQEARGLAATGYLDGGQAELLRAAAVPSVAAAVPVEPPAAAAEVAAPPGRAGDGVPAAAEAAASTADLRVAGGPGARASRTAATDAPAAEPTPARARAVNCDGWNTQEFFETATAESVTACLVGGADIADRTDDGHTPLHYAAWFNGSPAVVEALLAAGADLNAGTGGDGHMPVHEAANNENPAVLQAVLAAGADAMARDDSGRTPLHYAGQSNTNPAVLQLLLSAGADIEARDYRGFTPLHRAANVNESLPVLEALLAAGADVHAPSDGGAAPVQNASFANENPAVLEALFAAGADPQAQTGDGRTLLHLAAQNNDNPAVIDALLSAGADIEARTDGGWTPLHLAAQGNENPAVAEVLLAAGANPRVRGGDGGTPLILAARENENPAVATVLLEADGDAPSTDLTAALQGPAALRAPALVEALLAAGADPMARGLYRETSLEAAARYSDSPAVVEVLLAAGGDVNARGGFYNGTSLHSAAQNGHQNAVGVAAVVETLLSAGADVTARAMLDETPLHYAYRSTVVEVLLAAGADAMARGSRGNTPLHRSISFDRSIEGAAVEALLAAGADPMARDNGGDTPLHDVLGVGAAHVLLAAGADVMARSEDGATPLHAAGENCTRTQLAAGAHSEGCVAIVEALLAAGADVMARTASGLTPLHTAFCYGFGFFGPLVAETLLAAEAAANARAENGNTPLHCVTRAGSHVDYLTDAIDVLLAAGADPTIPNADGQTPLDLAQENERLQGSDAYWRMNDARFNAPPRPESRRPTRSGPVPPRFAASATQGRRMRACEIPGYPVPGDVQNLGLNWCGPAVDFQLRAFALQAAASWCAIAQGTSSSPDQIARRHMEINTACDRLDALNDRLGGGGPSCRCPADYRP